MLNKKSKEINGTFYVMYTSNKYKLNFRLLLWGVKSVEEINFIRKRL